MPAKPKLKRYFNLPLSLEAANYYDVAARARNIMPGPLMIRVLEIIHQHNMLDNVLDDKGRVARKPLEKPYRHQPEKRKITVDG